MSPSNVVPAACAAQAGVVIGVRTVPDLDGVCCTSAVLHLLLRILRTPHKP
jgi:hypothetical protein